MVKLTKKRKSMKGGMKFRKVLGKIGTAVTQAGTTLTKPFIKKLDMRTPSGAQKLVNLATLYKNTNNQKNIKMMQQFDLLNTIPKQILNNTFSKTEVYKTATQVYRNFVEQSINSKKLVPSTNTSKLNTIIKKVEAFKNKFGIVEHPNIEIARQIIKQMQTPPPYSEKNIQELSPPYSITNIKTTNYTPKELQMLVLMARQNKNIGNLSGKQAQQTASEAQSIINRIRIHQIKQNPTPIQNLMSSENFVPNILTPIQQLSKEQQMINTPETSSFATQLIAGKNRLKPVIIAQSTVKPSIASKPKFVKNSKGRIVLNLVKAKINNINTNNNVPITIPKTFSAALSKENIVIANKRTRKQIAAKKAINTANTKFNKLTNTTTPTLQKPSPIASQQDKSSLLSEIQKGITLKPTSQVKEQTHSTISITQAIQNSMKKSKLLNYVKLKQQSITNNNEKWNTTGGYRKLSKHQSKKQRQTRNNKSKKSQN